jgi:hypothetical protein
MEYYFYHDLLIVIMPLLLVLGICLGLIIAIAVYLFSGRNNPRPPISPSTPAANEVPPKPVNPTLEEISSKLDKMRQEQIRDKWENVSYILWGFTLAMIGITFANPHPANIAATIVFFFLGWAMWIRARLVK